MPPKKQPTTDTYESKVEQSIGKRDGAPSARVKKNMQASGETDAPIAAAIGTWKKAGRKNKPGNDEIHAAHKLSDHSFREITTHALVEAPQLSTPTRHAAAKAYKGVVEAIWHEPSQTKTQAGKVQAAVGFVSLAVTQRTELTTPERHKVAKGVKVLTNDSLANIRPGAGGPNMSIGAIPDQGFQLTPGKTHLENTPRTRRIRQAVEKYEQAVGEPVGTFAAFRRDPRTSQSSTSRPPKPVVFSPIKGVPAASAPVSKKTASTPASKPPPVIAPATTFPVIASAAPITAAPATTTAPAKAVVPSKPSGSAMKTGTRSGKRFHPQ